VKFQVYTHFYQALIFLNMTLFPFTMSFNSQTTIYQTEVRCHVNENDFNYTLNPSAIKSGSIGALNDNVSGSDFMPYATTVGLYNSRNELLAVGKLSTPYPISRHTDTTFIIKYDS